MSRLLEKIKRKRAYVFADLRKTSNDADSQYTNAMDLLCISKEDNQTAGPNTQNTQSLWTRKPTPRKDIHKSTNTQSVAAKNENQKPATATNSRTTIPVSNSSPQSKLVRLAIQAGIYEHALVLEEKEVAALVPPSDWRDTANCTLEELKAWGACLALRAVRYRGKIPAGWDQVANCDNCGLVYSFAAGDCLACPWCELKRAGKWFPAPTEGEAKS